MRLYRQKTAFFLSALGNILVGLLQVVIVLTASASQKIHRTKKQALRARKTGLTFLVIGVGKKINEEELRIISGPGAVPETNNVSALKTVNFAGIQTFKGFFF